MLTGIAGEGRGEALGRIRRQFGIGIGDDGIGGGGDEKGGGKREVAVARNDGTGVGTERSNAVTHL